MNKGFKYKDSWTGELSMYIGIPIVGFLLTFVFENAELEYFTSYHAIHAFFSILVTGINWVGCRYLVIRLWNKYPWHIKPVQHILIEIPVMLGFTIGIMALSAYSFVLFSQVPFDTVMFWRNTSVVIIMVLFLVSYHEAMFFYHQWKENFNKSAILEKDNIKAEYDALKSQVNPHFLFNNLNTLVTYVEDNDEAVDYIQNLSDFLRYTLDERNNGTKTIKEELDLVNKYIFLQKSRFNEYLNIDIDIPKIYHSYMLPSLSLQMLVDNSIKHNVVSKTKPLKIKIYIEDENYIVVENNLQKKQSAISTKKGLNNLLNRFSFLSEKNIIILEIKDKFIVKLPLVLNIKP